MMTMKARRRTTPAVKKKFGPDCPCPVFGLAAEDFPRGDVYAIKLIKMKMTPTIP
jgi:hypothetical protein